jgi:hypothetical protein
LAKYIFLAKYIDGQMAKKKSVDKIGERWPTKDQKFVSVRDNALIKKMQPFQCSVCKTASNGKAVCDELLR